MADIHGNEGGVCSHSTSNFWDEYDLWKVKSGVLPDYGTSFALKQKFGLKRMVYRKMVDGITDVGTVFMINKEHRAGVWDTLGLQHGEALFEDEFWAISRPDNLGGGKFTRKLTLQSWDEDTDTEDKMLGYIHECGGEQSWEHDFIFNDFTQKRHWYVHEQRVPYPGRRATRSLGTAYPKSVGARYGEQFR